MSSLDVPSNGMLRLLVPVAILAAVGLAAFFVVNEIALDRAAADSRALAARDAELTARTLTPGSALACLDAGAGETAESACEASVFASPQSTAAAVAYIGARMTLLAQAAGQPAALKAMAASRRAIELDRFGIAAHVLALRDGCTPAQCAAFALVSDAGTLKANMKAQAFDQYVSRHAIAWNAPPAGTPVASQTPAVPAPAAQASVAAPGPQAVSSKYDFPSSDSIPAVSIMNAEPPRSNEASANAAAPAPSGAAAPATEATPVPPKRPQAASAPADITPAR